MTMNDTWGFKSYDENWKSAETLVRQARRRRVEGRQLPAERRTDGRRRAFPAPSVERLAAVGQWMQVNGEAIYGTTASPFTTPLPWGRATSKAGTLYLHVFDWPADGKLHLTPEMARQLGGTPARAYRLALPDTAMSVAGGDDGLTIRCRCGACGRGRHGRGRRAALYSGTEFR